MTPHTDHFLKLVVHPVKFRIFLLSRLPAAFFAGVRVREADVNRCRVTVPYKWFTRNPFRSTYFACLGMAAEMSTGTLAMAHLYKSNPPVSMLVVKVESDYFKKVTGTASFVCEDGDLFRKAVEETLATGESRTVRARSAGKNTAGEPVAEFYVTWSIKIREKK